MRWLEPGDVCFRAIDLVQGFHHVPIHEDSRNLLPIISPQLEAFINFPTPSCKKDIQSICGAAAQLKRWTPGLMIESPSLQKLCAANVPFYWNDDLQLELNAMKAALKEHAKAQSSCHIQRP